MASSFLTSAGSRASGAVISAASSARSEPIGQGSMRGGKIPQEPGQQPLRLAGIGLQHRDDRGDIDMVVLGVPAIVIGHHGDGGVGRFPPRGRAWLQAWRSCRSRRSRRPGRRAIRRARRIAGPPCRHRCRRFASGMSSAAAAAAMRSCSRGATGCAIETCATQPLPKKEDLRARRCGRRTGRRGRKARAAAPP